MNVYIAASFAYADRAKTEGRKAEIESVVAHLRNYLDADFYLPHQLKIPNAWDMSLEAWAAKVFEHDLAALKESNLVIFISYGKENNAGSVWECGYAYASNIPVVVIKMTDDVESLMISNSAKAVLRKDEIDNYNWEMLPEYKTALDKLS